MGYICGAEVQWNVLLDSGAETRWIWSLVDANSVKSCDTQLILTINVIWGISVWSWENMCLCKNFCCGLDQSVSELKNSSSPCQDSITAHVPPNSGMCRCHQNPECATTLTRKKTSPEGKNGIFWKVRESWSRIWKNLEIENFHVLSVFRAPFG